MFQPDVSGGEVSLQSLFRGTFCWLACNRLVLTSTDPSEGDAATARCVVHRDQFAFSASAPRREAAVFSFSCQLGVCGHTCVAVFRPDFGLWCSDPFAFSSVPARTAPGQA